MGLLKSKLLVVAVCVLLFAAAVPQLPVFAASTWFVDDSGGADFTTISAAVAAAAAGDTIIVKDGTYAENVVVDKSLIIQSENGAASTVVVAANSALNVFDVNVNGVVIDGFSISGSTSNAGVDVQSVSHCVIRNNDISGCKSGVYVAGTSPTNNTITKNNCHGNERGIQVRGSATGNYISENTVQSSTQNGFVVKDTAANNWFWLNNIVSNPTDIVTANTFNSPAQLNYTYNGNAFTGYLGNYWYLYGGADADGNGVGDTSFKFGSSSNYDYYPLMMLSENYPPTEPEQPPNPLGNTPWPCYGHDLRNTGRSPYVGPQSPVVKWAVQTSTDDVGSIWAAPVIGADGTIYIGTAPYVGDGKFYAFNPNGTEKWTFQPVDYNVFWGSAAIAADGTVYVVGTTDDTGESMFYALDPDDGSVKWQFWAPTLSYTSPKIGDDGTIYFADEATLYAVNPDGAEKWNFAQGGMSWTGTLVIGADGTIYTLTDLKLYAVNPDGTEKWNFTTNGYEDAMTIADDGTIYIAPYLDGLYAVNPDGSQKWFIDSSTNFYALAIGVDGTLYAGSEGGIFYALNSDGTEKWQFTAGSEIYGAPAIGADGIIYFACYNGRKVFALNPSGTEKWNFTTDYRIGGSLAIGANGTLYVPSGDSSPTKLYAFVDLPEVVLPSMNLTIIGPNGATQSLNETGIVTFAPYSNYGGFMKQGSTTIVNLYANFTGIPLTTLCNLVGAVTENTFVEVVASDGTNYCFSYTQIVDGIINATSCAYNYNLTTITLQGEFVSQTQPLTIMLAYKANGTFLSSGGPLRAVIVGSENLLIYSGGKPWVKNVTNVSIWWIGDFDSSHAVDYNDIIHFVDAYIAANPSSGTPTLERRSDLNFDGKINYNDIIAFVDCYIAANTP
jgi:parallel beta-helix repeat protein